MVARQEGGRAAPADASQGARDGCQRTRNDFSEAVMRSTRFAVRGLAVVTALAFALAACDDDEVTPPPQITVSVAPQNHTMNVGDQVTFNAIVSGTQNQSVTWESTDGNVVSINATSGVATANSAGTAVIIATSAADPNAKGQATVTVNPPPAIEVTISPNPATVQVNQTVQLTAVVTNSTTQAVTWSSLTPNIATVDGSGVVTGVEAGTAIIEAASQEDPTRKGQATVNVLPEVPVNVVIQDIQKGGAAAPRNNLSGQIEVVIEFDTPPGSNVSKLEVLVDDVAVCSQNIGSGEAHPADDAQAQTTFARSLLTHAVDAPEG